MEVQEEKDWSHIQQVSQCTKDLSLIIISAKQKFCKFLSNLN